LTVPSPEPDPWIDTILFDNELLKYGSWDEPTKGEILDWIRTTDIEAKGAKASSLVSKLVPRFLGTACSPYGRKKANELGRQFTYLERLIVTTRSGIEEKFYRDHLNHMIRVMLLTRALATTIRSLEFDDQMRDWSCVVALMHDLAYPLAEARRIFTATQKALRQCYGSIRLPELAPAYEAGVLIEKFNLIPLPEGKDASFLKSLVEDYHHAFIGAIEFLTYIGPDPVSDENLKIIGLAAQAIALHDSKVQTEIRFSKNPLLTMLVLCDEMQDWGRPVGFSKSPLISSMHLSLSKDGLLASYDLRGLKRFAPLQLLHSKEKSLQRVVLDSGFRGFSLKFSLPHYDQIDVLSVERVLQKLYTLDEFSEAISGRAMTQLLSLGQLPMSGHSRLRLHRFRPEEFRSTQFEKTSPFKDHSAFFDPDSHELVVVRWPGLPTHIEFVKSDDGKVVARLEQRNPDSSTLGTIVKSGEDAMYDSIWNRFRRNILAVDLALLVTQLARAKRKEEVKNEDQDSIYRFHSLVHTVPGTDALREWGLDPSDVNILSQMSGARIGELSFYAFSTSQPLQGYRK
jgi:hypothetical protein